MNRTQDANFDRDIFVSYASEDRARVLPIVSWLESRGWTVWWDRTIAPGQRWDETIERALNAARCVMVVWSRSSRESDWVKTEAAVAARRNALVPIRIDDVEVPLEFSRLQALDLIDWRGQPDTPELRLLEQTIAGALGRPPVPQPLRIEPRRNRRLTIAAAAVLVLALGGWWFYGKISGPAHSGAALASAALLLLDDLERKTDETGAYWPFALAEAGNGALLQQATLLGVEAVRRGARAEGEAALRRSLALLTRPARTFVHGVAMTCLAISTDGARVATGGEDGSIAIWDTATSRLVARFAAHTAVVQHLAFSPDGRILASGGRDNSVRLSDPQSGRELARLPHEDMVWSVAFSPDGARLATAADETSHVWSVADARELHRLKHAANVRAALFTSDGKFVVTAPGTSGSPALVSVWDASSGHLMKELGGANDRFYGIATRGSVLAAAKRGGIDLWRTSDWNAAGRIAFDHGSLSSQ